MHRRFGLLQASKQVFLNSGSPPPRGELYSLASSHVSCVAVLLNVNPAFPTTEDPLTPCILRPTEHFLFRTNESPSSSWSPQATGDLRYHGPPHRLLLSCRSVGVLVSDPPHSVQIVCDSQSLEKKAQTIIALGRTQPTQLLMQEPRGLNNHSKRQQPSRFTNQMGRRRHCITKPQPLHVCTL